jgi:hypothetical protein
MITVFAALLAASAPDASAGAHLVATYGCRACHASDLGGIARRLNANQIAAALLRPAAPMPSFGFTATEAGDIAAYLTQGVADVTQPVITTAPAHPSDYADVTVRFPGEPPKNVTLVALMSMGGMKMHSQTVTMKPGSDPHVFTGHVDFSMDGTWTLHVVYDGTSFDRTIDVGQ